MWCARLQMPTRFLYTVFYIFIIFFFGSKSSHAVFISTTIFFLLSLLILATEDFLVFFYFSLLCKKCRTMLRVLVNCFDTMKNGSREIVTRSVMSLAVEWRRGRHRRHKPSAFKRMYTEATWLIGAHGAPGKLLLFYA